MSAKTKAATAKSTSAAKANKGFEFYNCDGEKSGESMNPTYNAEVYKDTKVARAALLAKVEAEMAGGTIQVSDLEAVKQAILEGSPTDANNCMTFGCIVEKVVL